MKPVIIAILMLGFPAVTYATQVSGDVWGVWDSTMNPIEVIGELRVPPDSSLIIGPGCYIEFQEFYALTVDTSAAFIRAIGTEQDSITFTSAFGRVWNGIDIYLADSACVISYCIMEKGMAIEGNSGGAIYCISTDLTLNNCSLRNNRAPDGLGGGIYVGNSNIEIIECEFTENSCGFGGAGLYSSHGNVSVINSLFESDTTWYPWGGEMAGAIGCQSSQDVVLSGNTFTDNFSGMIGNIIMSATATITSNDFINNSAWHAAGGLILIVEDSASVMDNLFEGNWAGTGSGGGLYFRGENSVITGNIFIENRVARGGGLYLQGSYIRVFQNLLAFNIADADGGGVYINGTNMTLENNVISYNSANGAGGVYSDNSSPFTPITMINNIVWGNTATSWPQIYIRHHPLEVSYCNVQGGWQGVGNIDVDPLFRDIANGDFHLMSTFCGDPYDSPCIDVGDPAIQDYLLDCDWGLGLQLSDMGAYGGGDSTLQAVEDCQPPLPTEPILLQNYPNPFNAATNIEFILSRRSFLSITIYNILGQEVAILYRGIRQAGAHTISWDASDFPSGVYFARLEAGGYTRNIKMLLLK
ncbi:MAG: right-handed parallel beta-helix repeat-containing protein [Candidatus Zixiibacteriota bacterium]|nr:MAG: right-handed parallel beta-helix repeat-containing protein [candidate division Zixibacteria bacterium]